MHANLFEHHQIKLPKKPTLDTRNNPKSGDELGAEAIIEPALELQMDCLSASSHDSLVHANALGGVPIADPA